MVALAKNSGLQDSAMKGGAVKGGAVKDADAEGRGASREAQVASPDALLARMPPSERDFYVFEEVVVRCEPTRLVARTFEISQTRVCQIVQRVWEWHEQVLPHLDRGANAELLLKGAKLLAADRLQLLYGEALACFEVSKKTGHTRIRRDAHGTETRITSTGPDPRYLYAALRVVQAQSKAESPLGLMTASLAMAGDAALALVHEAEAAAAETAAAQVTSAQATSDAAAAAETAGVADGGMDHPKDDCSSQAETGGRSADPGADRDSVKPFVKKTSAHLNRKQRRAREKFFRPVQPADQGGAAELVTQLKLRPNQPGAGLQQHSASLQPPERASA